MKRRNAWWLLVFLAPACSAHEPVVDGDGFRVEFNQQMESRVITDLDGSEKVLTEFHPSEYVLLSGGEVPSFQLVGIETSGTEDSFGRGAVTVLLGESERLSKKVEVTTFADFPGMAIFQVTYQNQSAQPVRIQEWVNNNYALLRGDPSSEGSPFWSFQGASYRDRRDWVLPVTEGFSQENYLGMNASDYGGGTPVVDLWRKDVGLAVGHVETVPKLVSLPVDMPSPDRAVIGVRQKVDLDLGPGEGFRTLRTFVKIHTGDHFETLRQYREIMLRQGASFRDFPASTYEPIWCGWGYGRDFTMQQMYGALPKVRDLGFRWAVLDDGWQTAEGDWDLLPDKFPAGDTDMKRFTEQVRAHGLRPKLWWVPLAVDPETRLMSERPELALINSDGEYQKISWWDAYYLCPGYEPVREYTRALVEKILRDWDYDGLKIDGQHLNGVPPCHNPAHGHAVPEESVEGLPGFFKEIYESALAIKPDAVVEICPCGTSYSFFTMPYMNQPVSSDPLSSWQIRLKGKTLKALMGIDLPYYGDHVELSDGGEDFASTIGIGGVPGTKFTWPPGSAARDRNDLTPEREKLWARWLEIYREKRLAEGEYRGELYDIGFDRPEAHAVSRDNRMYYAFYAPEFSGRVELRGLLDGTTYQVRDYVNDVELGSVQGPTGRLEASFSGSLLLEAIAE